MSEEILFSGLLSVMFLALLSAGYSYFGKNKYVKVCIWPFSLVGLVVFGIGQETEALIVGNLWLAMLLLTDRVLTVILFFVWTNDFAHAFYGVPPKFSRKKGD